MIEINGCFHRTAQLRIAIVASRFNDAIVKELVAGASDSLRRHGIPEEQMTLVWVPGAFEIPLIAKKLATSGSYDAVICLGVVIRGSTPHFDLVAGEVAGGISHAALESGIPVLFGILTTDTIEQAIERAGTKAGNKGKDAALAALEMIDLLSQLSGAQSEKSNAGMRLRSCKTI